MTQYTEIVFVVKTRSQEEELDQGRNSLKSQKVIGF
ncbi:hypothetical protein NIES806_29660 [Dolichospermum compactum NIES-806]|uniref:Uncharacterized protein n=1 Tax=Dolichospermum compactum NIES-806 TaxID=1973481 RepID=A0A1Z4V5B7_9CYAN|nr:hypothetical protein NIES806_29660 [Dolichospermum compactum NIES-806]